MSQPNKKYGFKAKICPPQYKERDNFEVDLTNLVRKIKFHKQLQAFLKKKQKGDITKINSSHNTYVENKTRNLYEISSPK